MELNQEAAHFVTEVKVTLSSGFLHNMCIIIYHYIILTYYNIIYHYIIVMLYIFPFFLFLSVSPLELTPYEGKSCFCFVQHCARRA